MNNLEPTIIKPSLIVECPYCKYQYLAGESLYPEDIIGHPSNVIVRDPLGKILYAEYKEDCEPKETDEFYCYNCKHTFIINIETKFTTTKQEDVLNFTDDTVSLL